jgi:hypothetical protein
VPDFALTVIGLPRNIDRLTADVRTNLPICFTRTWPILICNISTNIVGTATRNGMDRPQIDSSRQNPRPIQPTGQEIPGSFPGVKRQERGAAQPPPSSAGLQMDWHYSSPSPLRMPRHAMGWNLISTISSKNNLPSVAFIISKIHNHILSQHNKRASQNITPILGTWIDKHNEFAVRE